MAIMGHECAKMTMMVMLPRCVAAWYNCYGMVSTARYQYVLVWKRCYHQPNETWL